MVGKSVPRKAARSLLGPHGNHAQQTIGGYLIQQPGLRHRARVRPSRRLRAAVLLASCGQPDPGGGTTARQTPVSPPMRTPAFTEWGPSASRTAGGLSLCNSIARAYAEKSPVDRRSAGPPGVDERQCEPALAPPRPRFQYAARGLREDHRRLGVARRSAHGISRNRPVPGRLRSIQTARLPRTSPRPRPLSGPVPASTAPSEISSRPATKRRSAEAARRGHVS